MLSLTRFLNKIIIKWDRGMKNGFIGNTDSTSLTLSLKSVPKIGEREGDLIMYLEEVFLFSYIFILLFNFKYLYLFIYTEKYVCSLRGQRRQKKYSYLIYFPKFSNSKGI